MSSCRSITRSRLAALLSLCVALSAGVQPLSAEPDDKPIRIGFMDGVFKNKNETDVLAALKVWAMTLAEERGISIASNMPVFRSQAEVEKALLERKIDALTLSLDEYAGFPAGLIGGPYVSHTFRRTTDKEFVIIARKDRGPASLQELQGARLAVHDNQYAVLATTWLDAELTVAGLALAADQCESVEHLDKLSATVLGVYFGKHDAGLVSKDGFLSMAELNPQVGKQLHILEGSPPLIPSMFCFRADLEKKQKDRFLHEVLRLHQSIIGEQVLRVFKSDLMSEVPDDHVAHSLALLAQWRAAIGDAGKAPLQALRREE